jgi:hypothetical protein
MESKAFAELQLGRRGEVELMDRTFEWKFLLLATPLTDEVYP